MTNLQGENNCDVFKYLKPNDSIKLSTFKRKDLYDVLRLINAYNLEMRDTLGYSENVTYGLEVEFEHSNNSIIDYMLNIFDLSYRWYVKHDETLIEGGEIASPILVDRAKDWNEFQDVCLILQNNAIIGENCGGHIHIGTHVLGKKKEAWKNFLLLYAVYENIIFRFVYGEYLNHRPQITDYAFPIARMCMDTYEHYDWNASLLLKELKKDIDFERYQAINFFNSCNRFNQIDDNTIEFRSPNGTLEPVIWQNNLNLFLAMIKYAKSSHFDKDTILKRYQDVNCLMGEIYYYNRIYKEQAIEFADLIFQKNIDKVYFLRQYFKSFEVSDIEFVKCKQFVKK